MLLVISCKKQSQVVKFATFQELENIAHYNSYPLFDTVNNTLNQRPSSVPGSYTLARAFEHLYPLSGIESTFDVKNLGNESGRSAWNSMRIGSVWIQIGYEKRGVHVLQYYYGTLDSAIIVNPTAPMYMGAKNTFFIRNIPGTTWWEIGRNGVVIIKWQGYTNVGSSLQVGIEYYGANNKFPTINFYPALKVLRGSDWIDAPGAYCSYRGAKGIEGNIQNPSLRYNELNMGSDVPLYPGLYYLFQQ